MSSNFTQQREREESSMKRLCLYRKTTQNLFKQELLMQWLRGARKSLKVTALLSKTLTQQTITNTKSRRPPRYGVSKWFDK